MAIIEDGHLVGDQTPLPWHAVDLFEYTRHERAFMTAAQLEAYKADGTLTTDDLRQELTYLVSHSDIVIVPDEDAPAVAAELAPESVATPAATAHAGELGVDPAQVEGTGKDGAITKADAAAAAETQAAPEPAPELEQPQAPEAPAEENAN